MKYSLLLLGLLSCQDYNSNSSDRIKFGPITIDDGVDPNLKSAYAIIQNRCVNCHSSTIHNVWSTYTSNELWLTSGVVNRGDPNNSSLILRIINSGQASSNMPQGGSALSASEYNALVKWVTEIP